MTGNGSDVTLLDRLERLPPDRRLGRPAEYFDTIDSTNRHAADWARQGAPEGALVVANHQLDGRGRRGRAWLDTAGESLLMSLVLRPTGPAERLTLLPLAAGIAVAEAVEPLVGSERVALKWPNDLLVDHRKAGGILVESSVVGEDATMVLGIGLNVNQASFPPSLADVATSLRLATSRVIDRDAVLEEILTCLERWYDHLLGGRSGLVVGAFRERMRGLGENATIRRGEGEQQKGRIAGIGSSGALLLDTGECVLALQAGDVSLEPAFPHPTRVR